MFPKSEEKYVVNENQNMEPPGSTNLGSLELAGGWPSKAIPPGSPSPSSSLPSGSGFQIVLHSNDTQKITRWNGSSFEDLVRIYNREFFGISSRIGIPSNPRMTPANELAKWRNLQERAFYIADKESGVFYECFKIEDIYINAHIYVHTPLLRRIDALERKLWASQGNNPAANPLATSSGTVKPTPPIDHLDKSIEMDETAQGGMPQSAWDDASKPANGVDSQPNEATAESRTLRAKIWATVDDPSSSPLAYMLTCASMLLIVFSTFTFCIESLPQFYTPDTDQTSWWYIAEAVCIGFFTLEAIVRLATCPNLREYLGELLNIIDIIAILPFYIELMLQSIEVPGLAVFRVVRLVRVFRMMKVSRGSIMIFAETMLKSQKPLYMLVALTSIAMIVLASLIYYVERGRFHESVGVWQHVSHYMCPVTIKRDFVIQDDYVLKDKMVDPCVRVLPQPEGLTEYEAQFMCAYNFRKRSSCSKVYAQTDFESIPRTFSFVLQTMTTVGYGDESPNTKLGKVVGSIIMVFGMLVIALPITVIGSNFSKIYLYAVDGYEVESEGGEVPGNKSMGKDMDQGAKSEAAKVVPTKETPTKG